MNTDQFEIHQWQKRDMVLNECLERFGSMNKNDYEVALFYLLLENQYSQLSDYEISIKMRIPESKVKRLRYEVSLRYYNNSNTDQYKKDLADLLLNCKYRIHNDRIQFAISDKMFRLYISNVLMKDGRFADTSFNVNIISMTTADLLFLISKIDAESEKIIEKMKQDFKNKETELPKGVIEALTDLSKEAVMAIVEKTITESVADKLKDFTCSLYEKVKDSIKK